MLNAYIGRQPIYDRDLNIYGYELLYREDDINNEANFDDGNLATSKVIINSFIEIGLSNIVQDKIAFINITKEFITGDFLIPFDPKQVVLEILEDIEIDERVLSGTKYLSSQMFQLAIDDFVTTHKDREQLLPYIKIVKLDLPQMSHEDIMKSVYLFKKKGIKVLAEKVETKDEFEFCKECGCDFFQGYFLSKPKIIKHKRLPNNHLAIIKLLSMIEDPNVPISDLEDLIATDVSLSYKILKYINSAYFSLNSPIKSIQRAIIFIGLATIRQWIMIISLSKIQDKPIALIETAIIRSKMSELIATDLNKRSVPSYSTTGLLSLLDTLLEQPMEALLENLPLTDEINLALLSREGEIGEVLDTVIAYEEGDWARIEELGWESADLRPNYLKAIKWAKAVTDNLISEGTN